MLEPETLRSGRFLRLTDVNNVCACASFNFGLGFHCDDLLSKNNTGDQNGHSYGFGLPWGSNPFPSPALTLVLTFMPGSPFTEVSDG